MCTYPSGVTIARYKLLASSSKVPCNCNNKRLWGRRADTPRHWHQRASSADPSFCRKLFRKQGQARRGALQLGSSEGNIPIGKFLIASGANKNNADHMFGNPPLFAAISSHQYDFLEMLLDAKADILHVSRTGGNLLHLTARWG